MPGNDGRSFLPINNKHTGHAALHVHVCATGNSWKSMLACLCNTLRYVCRVGYTSFNECATAEAAACEYSLIDVFTWAANDQRLRTGVQMFFVSSGKE